MSENNVVKFPFKDLGGSRSQSQVVEKEEIVNLDNIEEATKEKVEEKNFQSFTSEQIEKIKSEYYQKGVNETTAKLAEAHASEKAELISSISTLKGRFEDIEMLKKNFSDEVINAASQLSISIGKKIIGANAENYKDKVLEFFKQVLPKLLGEDTIYINLNGKFAGELEQSLKEVVKQSNYTGNLKIVGNDGIAEGECEVNWNSGCAKYNPSELLERVDELFSQLGVNYSESVEKTDNDDKEAPKESLQNESL
jgi:flagellar biosynthesis/type III secretory pathway protein FliH